MNDIAICIAAHGAVLPGSDEGFAAFAADVRAAYPGLPVVMAFTSSMVRERLSRSDRAMPSPPQVIRELARQGARRVVVQSLHVIVGQDYEDTFAACRALQAQGVIAGLAMGRPLLADDASAKAAALALPSITPPARAADEALVLVGHGSGHRGAELYDVFVAEARTADPLVFLGLLSGGPGPAGVAAEARRRGARGAWLLPLLSAPGMHVRRDIAGDAPDSWASGLSAHGLPTRCVTQGALEHPALRALWLGHLRAAMARLASP